MSSYFEEHNCTPLKPGEAPDHYLHFTRMLLDGGYWQEIGLEFAQIFGFGENPPPPTAKKTMEELIKFPVPKQEGECTICLKKWPESIGEQATKLPCEHFFHAACILPWLQKTNSCPTCRYELPTDDPDYELMRKQKKRQKEKTEDLERLHDSMFS